MTKSAKANRVLERIEGMAHRWVYETPDLARCHCGWELRQGLQKLTREAGPEFWREVEGGAPVLVRSQPPCAP